MTDHVFFGGKGGVGKTTVACAHGLNCAEAGERVLLVSTDPAHSTSDVFDQAFGDDPRPVEGIEGLDALEIDPEREVEAHMEAVKRRLADQVSPALVNEIDRQIELAHRTPGAHEAALFDRLVEVMREREGYDRVVFDTSPTGATLRLLALPEYLEAWIERLLAKRKRGVDLYEKAAVGAKEPEATVESDPVVEHLRERKAMFEYAREALPLAEYYLVVNPDELSIRETRRAIETLDEYGLAVEGLVVNRVTPMPDPDERGPSADYLREKAATERDRIAEIRETFDRPVVAELETRTAEIKGDLLDDAAAELAIRGR